MNEIYWIERLDYIQGFFIVLLTILGIILLFKVLVSFVEEKKDKFWKAKNIWLIGAFIICYTILSFIPSTAVMYRIYGIGGTIDFLKSNPEAKQLPDKTIKIINKWADKMLDDNKNKDKEK